MAEGITFVTIDPRSARAATAMGRYYAELDSRFSGGFDPGEWTDDDLLAFAAPAGAFVVAVRDGRDVACGAVQCHDGAGATGEIKRMWVDPDTRGVGLGRAMLAALEGAASELGYGTVVLDTNGTLTEAIRMYLTSGYTEIERYNDNPYAQHWFAKPLTAR